MIRYLTISDVLELHRRVVAQTGGAIGVRDLNALESAVAQPRMTFGGTDLYPGLAEKAASLGFSLVKNHPLCGREQADRSRCDGGLPDAQWL